VIIDERPERGGRRGMHLKSVFNAIRELMAPPEPKSRRQIGFISGD